MIVRVLTTCHTQYTSDSSICIFLFNRTTLQVFVTFLTGALYVHPLWFYKHQHDRRVRSTQNAFSLPFAAILVNCAPSGEMHNYCTPHVTKDNRISRSIGATTYSYLKCIVYDKLIKPRQSFWITLYIQYMRMYTECNSHSLPVFLWLRNIRMQSIKVTYRFARNGILRFKTGKGQGKPIPVTGLDRPWGFQEAEAPRFQDNRYTKVKTLSALRTGCLYLPRYSFLLEAESEPRAIVQAGRITSM